ncbi:hypothetical protein [Desulfogranum mediterraneum]|uniref:hypothetical protein n=1 Tax=Desulfogranum mediterraneum TaxID=160661 RepID=UPI00042261B8|nr:hypothetical protein [Desulfogranum mediterraneum]
MSPSRWPGRQRSLQGRILWLLSSLLCAAGLFGCGVKVDCSDPSQMLSSDRELRASWLRQCRELNRRIKVNGVVQPPSPSP